MTSRKIAEPRQRAADAIPMKAPSTTARNETEYGQLEGRREVGGQVGADRSPRAERLAEVPVEKVPDVVEELVGDGPVVAEDFGLPGNRLGGRVRPQVGVHRAGAAQLLQQEHDRSQREDDEDHRYEPFEDQPCHQTMNRAISGLRSGL